MTATPDAARGDLLWPTIPAMVNAVCEVGMAWVVRRPAADVEDQTLIEWCRERLANYKVPRYVEFVDALPTNASGKVVKFELADRGRSLVAAGLGAPA